jgi:hypothetical protein
LTQVVSLQLFDILWCHFVKYGIIGAVTVSVAAERSSTMEDSSHLALQTSIARKVMITEASRGRIARAAVVLAAVAAVMIGGVPGGASATPTRATFTYATSAQWINGGKTLSITPSGFAQTLGIPAAQGVWNNAMALAGSRYLTWAQYDSMMEQLRCHLYFVFKTPYNLDTWRPSVSWWYELYTRCNP